MLSWSKSVLKLEVCYNKKIVSQLLLIIWEIPVWLGSRHHDAMHIRRPANPDQLRSLSPLLPNIYSEL